MIAMVRIASLSGLLLGASGVDTADLVRSGFVAAAKCHEDRNLGDATTCIGETAVASAPARRVGVYLHTFLYFALLEPRMNEGSPAMTAAKSLAFTGSDLLARALSEANISFHMACLAVLKAKECATAEWDYDRYRAAAAGNQH
jgi:hypothetical protein